MHFIIEIKLLIEYNFKVLVTEERNVIIDEIRDCRTTKRR